jgi:hypothetical protein
LLTTEVPYSSEIERMTLRRAPIAAYSPRSIAGQTYSALWTEIELRMNAGAQLEHAVQVPIAL